MMGRRRSRCPFSQLQSVGTILNDKNAIGRFALHNATGVTLNVQMVIASHVTYVKEHLRRASVIIAMFSDEHGSLVHRRRVHDTFQLDF